MKYISTILAVFCLQLSIHATIVLPSTKISPPEKNMLIPLIGTDKFVTIEEFLKLTPKTYKMLTGKKLGLDQKIDLVLSKMIIKKMIRKSGKVDLNTFSKEVFLAAGIGIGEVSHWDFS